MYRNLTDIHFIQLRNILSQRPAVSIVLAGREKHPSFSWLLLVQFFSNLFSLLIFSLLIRFMYGKVVQKGPKYEGGGSDLFWTKSKLKLHFLEALLV